MKKIIGLTGSLGSGCTTIAKHLESQGYSRVSISDDILSTLAQKYRRPFASRRDKQLFGNEVRKKYGDEYKTKLKTTIENCGERIVVECFRNPIEIEYFRNEYPHFYLISLYAPDEARKNRKREPDFDECNGRDEAEKDKFGQQVRKCVTQADIVIDNSPKWKHSGEIHSFFEKVDSYLELSETPSRPPSPEETIMHLAYSVSLHSPCLQRQVGAVINSFRPFRYLLESIEFP